jgi:hypothetical protein
MMQQQQQYHQQLFQQQLRPQKNENENCIQSSSSISVATTAPSSSCSSSLSPNHTTTTIATTMKLSPKQQHQFHSLGLLMAAEKHERSHHPLSINKHETACNVENGSKINNNSANRFNKAESYHHHQQQQQPSVNSGGGGSGRTVREELEASRSKIPKLGKSTIHSHPIVKSKLLGIKTSNLTNQNC